ncbi:MAG: Maf-like protein [Bacteroidales bacterium]|jgi:septum formation protein|nr:Maf-like protein [Bacteroidales bacterium]MDD3161370.1 Maf-like protein [Bacteroidales bacterium]
MKDFKTKYDIILGSQSPRRKELLSGLDIDFSVCTLPDIDESYPETLQGGDIPLFISAKKADAFRTMLQERTLLITADTIVWLSNRVYGKPVDEADAISMLKDLSGHTHEVFTGVTLTTLQKQKSFVVSTKVTFASLSDEEIYSYVTNYQPYDKAGAYGIQEWIGYIGVESISGSYFNVMGLPIQRLYRELLIF